MTINLSIPNIQELKPRITVFGVGGAGGNAVNNMISSGLEGVDFVVANTDAQALALTKAQRIIQLGVSVTEGLGAGSHPEVGRAAAEESFDEINDHLSGSHMVFITAGMGGGTGTGAAPVIARAAREQGILTVGVVTKPFQFEGNRRTRLADEGIDELHRHVDTLIVIPNQNLFRVANEKTTFADAFKMADQVLYSGVGCITDLMVKEGLINLDFADVRAVMRGMGKAMMGTGEASGEDRARHAAEAAIANPLLDDVSMHGARGLLISITGGPDLTLYEVDEAASRIREEVDADANIILGATFDNTLEGRIRVSVVATGTDATMVQALDPVRPNASRPAISAKRPSVEAALVRLRDLLFDRNSMVVNVTANSASWTSFRPELEAFLANLPTAEAPLVDWPLLPLRSEGFTFPGQVNYVAKGANLYPLGYVHTGASAVALRHLNTTYLWDKVRVQGGAYGGSASLDPFSGGFFFSSYRDPNLLETLTAYDGAGAYLREGVGEQDLVRSIIGAIGSIDTYRLPDAKGFISLMWELTGNTDENRQQRRDQVLGATVADFKRFGEVLAEVAGKGHVAVLGSEAAITAANDARGGFLEVTKVL